MEPEEYWKERYETLEEELKEMKKDCRETHANVAKDISKTIDSIHSLAREVNGKMSAVRDCMDEIKFGNEKSHSEIQLGIAKNSSKQKWYIITVLVSVIVLILSSWANFVYNRIGVKQTSIEAQKVLKSDSDLEKQLQDFLEAQHDKKEQIKK
jgi:cytochrome c-type biogenesis protein CcmH/NrfG